jgi:hypothetical protein
LEDVKFDFEVFREFEFGRVFSVHDVFPKALVFFVGDFLENGLEGGCKD